MPERSSAAAAPGHGWFTKQQVAAFLGVGENYVDRDLRPLLKAEDAKVEKTGKRVRRIWMKGPAVLEVCRAKWREDLARKTGSDLDDLEDGDSPVMNRLRLAKAIKAEIEVDRMQGTLVRAAIVEQALHRGFGLLRKMTETLEKRFGRDAGEIARQALSNAQEQALGFVDEQERRQEEDSTEVNTEARSQKSAVSNSKPAS